MNKRGDISTLVLVIGVFLVCAVAIFSFAFLNSSDKEKFASVIESMAKVNSFAEHIRFYENTGQDPASFLNITKKNGEYNITLNKIDEGERLFSVEYRIKARAQPPP